MSVLLINWRLGAINPEFLTQVRELAPDMRVVVAKDRQEMESLLPETGILVGHVTPDMLARAPNLRWCQQFGAGNDWILSHPQEIERDYLLTNGSGVQSVAVSEHVFAMLFALVRRLPLALRSQADAQWIKPGLQAVDELAGRTLVLVGLGAIGSRIARIACAMDMRVIGVRRNPDLPFEFADKVVGPGALPDVLPEADFLVLVPPLTDETMRLIGPQELAAMKSSAYLINVGRGRHVDEAALIEALRNKKIAGAGLDVFETEPLPDDSPLWKLENTIVTAHYGGSNPRFTELAFGIFLDNLRRYMEGKPLRNLVDKKLGY